MPSSGGGASVSGFARAWRWALWIGLSAAGLMALGALDQALTVAKV